MKKVESSTMLKDFIVMFSYGFGITFLSITGLSLISNGNLWIGEFFTTIAVFVGLFLGIGTVGKGALINYSKDNTDSALNQSLPDAEQSPESSNSNKTESE